MPSGKAAAPPAVEVAVATWLRRESVPAEDKARVNPVAGDAAAIARGQELFRQKCEVCHAYDGSGKTEIDAGQYPRPPALSSLNVMELTDGESFYCIRNGIRNTGMPAWPMPDAQLWQLVAYLRDLPHVATLSPMAAGHAATEGAHYVGSVACRSCHTAIYDRWKQTRPKERPDAIIPNLSKPDPLVIFTKDNIAFVYGSRRRTPCYIGTIVRKEIQEDPAGARSETDRVWAGATVHRGLSRQDQGAVATRRAPFTTPNRMACLGLVA
jgi:mono/diheme cytochrome c family protein